MVWKKYTYLLIRGLLLLFLGFPMASPAQEVFQYQGPLRIGPFSGNARYSYQVVQGDTLLTGPFSLERSGLDELSQTRDSTFVFSGSFKEGYPDDLWRFELGIFASDEESRMVDYQYRITLSGVQEQASGMIRKGRPTGTWEYIVQEIEKSAVSKTLFRSQFDFQGGVPQGSFRIENSEGNLIGRFLDGGYAHDEWALFYTSEIGASEQWNFLDGLLQNIQVTREDETRVLEFFGKRTAGEIVVPLDATYLKALSLYLPPGDSTRLSNLGIYRALEENDQNYAKLNAVLSAKGRADFQTNIKARLPHFPLDTVATEQLDSLALEVQAAQVIRDRLLNDTQLNLLKLTDPEARYAYATVLALDQAYLKPLESVVEDYQDDILQFIPLDEYIIDLWPSDKPTPELEVTMPEGMASETFSGPGAAQLDFHPNTLPTLLAMGTYNRQSLEAIESGLSDKLSKNRREQELIVLEEKMITQDLRLNKLLDSLSEGAEKRIQTALGGIRESADEELGAYAGMTDEAAKLERARILNACFEEMEALAQAVSRLPEQEAEIKGLYKDAVWNPFMAVIMDEELKKRITSAHRKILIPFLLEQVSTNLNCENAGDLNRSLSQLHERMLELLNEDTSRLERKLKRERDPLTVMELFGVNTEKLKGYE